MPNEKTVEQKPTREEMALKRFKEKKRALIAHMIRGEYDDVKKAINNERDFTRRYYLIFEVANYLTEISLAVRCEPNESYVLSGELSSMIEEYTAQKQGKSLEEIRNTPALQEEFSKAVEAECTKRGKEAYNSNYFQALLYLYQTEHNVYIIADISEKKRTYTGLINPALAALLYFFVSHRSINPAAENTITAVKDENDKKARKRVDEYKQEMLDLFRQIDDFYNSSGKKAAIKNTYDLLEAFEQARNPQPTNVLKVEPVDVSTLPFPIDKINHSIWDNKLWGNKTFEDGRPVDVITGNKGNEPVCVTVKLDFSEIDDVIKKYGVKMTKDLDEYDKRVYVIAGGLWDAAKKQGLKPVFSLQTVAELAGFSNRSDVERVKNCILKLASTIILIDNDEEIKAKFDYPRINYFDHALPARMVTANVNGVITDSAFELYSEPPLIEIAKNRKQCGLLPPWMLQIPTARGASMPITVNDHLNQQYIRWKRKRKNEEKDLDKLQRKATKRPEKMTDSDRARLDDLQKEITQPMRITKRTLLDKVKDPTPSKETKAAPEKQQGERADAAKRQQKARVLKQVRANLDEWVRNGNFARWTEDEKGFSLYQK